MAKTLVITSLVAALFVGLAVFGHSSSVSDESSTSQVSEVIAP